jgi:hypothetical protein
MIAMQSSNSTFLHDRHEINSFFSARNVRYTLTQVQQIWLLNIKDSIKIADVKGYVMTLYFAKQATPMRKDTDYATRE